MLLFRFGFFFVVIDIRKNFRELKHYSFIEISFSILKCHKGFVARSVKIFTIVMTILKMSMKKEFSALFFPQRWLKFKKYTGSESSLPNVLYIFTIKARKKSSYYVTNISFKYGPENSLFGDYLSPTNIL